MQTSNMETNFDKPSKSETMAENSEKEHSLGIDSEEQHNSLLMSTEETSKCINLQSPKDTHRRKRYHAPLETIAECDVNEYSDVLDSYSSSTLSSSTSGSSSAYECDETINLPFLPIIKSEDEDEDVQTLYCMEDWTGEEEEPTHEQTPDGGELLPTSNKSQNIKTLANKKRSSHIPLVNEATSSSVALLKYACRNLQYEKSLMEKHQPDSPGGDQNYNGQSKVVRPSIPPVLGAPDELPHILQDEYPPIDTINVVRKNSVINEDEKDEDIAIAILPKESIMNIQVNHNESDTDETELIEQESITSLSLQSLLKEMEDENYSHKGTELTMLGLNNMLNVLVMKMTEKINQVIDVTTTNDQVTQMKADRKQKKNLQRLKKSTGISSKEDTTESLINFPKRCNSDNCGAFPGNQQYKNTEILQELIQLVTTTITQLKLITQGTIISDCTPNCPTVFINTSAGPATATILSGEEFFMNPLCISSDNESESFLDFDLMYRKICMAEVESEIVNMVQSNTNNAIPRISFPGFGQESGNIRCRSNPDTNKFPDDLITLDNNSLLIGNYAAVDEDRSCSSPSLLDAPVQDLTPSFNSLQRNSLLQMLRTASNSCNCPTGDVLRTGSNRSPVEVMHHGEGVIELVGISQTNGTQNRYKEQNLHSYELRTLPATKDSEIEEFNHPQRTPYSLPQHEVINISDKSLQNEFSSLSSIASSNVIINRQLQLCLKSEKPPTERLGSDSAPVILNPDNPVYVGCLEELKKCVHDPSQYLQRCIAISANKQDNPYETQSPTQTCNNRDLQTGNKRANVVCATQNKNNCIKPNLNLPPFISGDYVCPNENKKSNMVSNVKKETKIKNSTSKQSLEKSSIKIDTKKSSTKNSSKDKIAISSKQVSQKDSSKLNQENISSIPPQKNLSNEIQDGVSKIIISVSKSGESVKLGTKKKKSPCGIMEELVLVPITTSQSMEGRDRTWGDNICPNNRKPSRLLTEDQIIHWLQQSKHDDQNREAETRQVIKEIKRKKSASFNVRKGSAKRRRRDQTLKLFLDKLQALLKSSAGVGLTKAISDSETRGKPGAMSSIVLDILMDSVKEGFLKGVSTATARSELAKIQKALSAPNSVYMMDVLLEKLCHEDPCGESDDLIEIERDFSNEGKPCIIADVSNPIILKAVPNEASHQFTNVSEEVATPGQPSTLANYQGSVIPSEKSDHQSRNAQCIEQTHPTKTKERLPKIKRKLSPKSVILSNRVQVPIVNKIYMDDFHQSVMPREDLYFDFEDIPVFDLTPDPPTAVSIQMTQGEISETSSVCSKPPLHPRSSKGNNKTRNVVIQNSKSKAELLALSDGRQKPADSEHFNAITDKGQFDEPSKGPLQIAQFSTQYSYALVGENGFTPCQEKSNTCFSEQIQYNSPAIQDQNSLQWIKYTAPQMLYNQTVDIQNTCSRSTNKKEKMPIKPKSKAGCALKTPESFFKAYRYSRKYRSSMCNGRCIYSDPRMYGRPCSPCRRSKAESLSLEYMETILKGALNRFPRTPDQRRNSAPRNNPFRVNRANSPLKMPFYRNPPQKITPLKMPFYRNSPQKITQSPPIKKQTGKECFPLYGPKAQVSKSSPSQVSPKFKNKEGPLSSKPISEGKNKTTVISPIKPKTMVSSSTENYSDSSKKSSTHSNPRCQKSESCPKKVQAQPENTRQPKSLRSQNRISALALPPARYLEDTRDRYKDVLKRGKLEWLDELMVLRKNVQSRARKRHRKKCSTETSSSSYQDLLSSTYSEISITEPNSSAQCQRTTTLKPSKRKSRKIEMNVLESGISNKVLRDRNTPTTNLNTEIFSDADTVTFGRYVFVGMGQYHPKSQVTNSLLNEGKSKTLNLKKKHNLENRYKKTKVPLDVRKIKTDLNIHPDEKCIRHRAGPMRAEDHVRTISDNSQSDNVICPQNISYRIDEPPLEMCTIPSSTRQVNSITNEQVEIKDARIQSTDREICPNYVSQFGSMTLTLLEFNILNHMPSILVNSMISSPYFSESLINEVRFTNKLERKLSEGSYVELRNWKKPLNMVMSEEFLKSSDSLTSHIFDDETSFSNKSTKGSCLSMSNGIHKCCIEGVINKIRSLFSETEISDFSDSGSLYTYNHPQHPENISSPEFVSSISNTDASIATNIKSYKNTECQSDSITSEKTLRTHIERIDTTLDKLNEETVIEIGMCEGTINSEIVLNFNNNNGLSNENNTCKDNHKGGNNMYSMKHKFQRKEDNEPFNNYKNNLQIEVSYDSNNNLIISFVSQYEQKTSSDNNSTESTASICFDRSMIQKRTTAHKSCISKCYKIHEAKIVCSIMEKFIKVIWERIKLMGISEKITIDKSQHSRYPIEQLHEISINQIFHFEYPLPTAQLKIAENIALKVNEAKVDTKEKHETALYEMFSPDALNSPSSTHIFPTESCAGYPAVSDIFYHDVSPMLISSSLHTISNIHALVESCSLTSVNSVLSLPFVKSLELISNAAIFAETKNVPIHEITNMSQSESSTGTSNDQEFRGNNSKTTLITPLIYCSPNETQEIICTSQESEESKNLSTCDLTSNPDDNSMLAKSLDFISIISEQDEQNELSIHDLTTPDMVQDLIAAFTHTPNEAAIAPSTSQLVEPTQPGYSPSNNFENLMEAITNLNSKLMTEEELFRSDLSSLENFIESLTSTSTLDSSYEELGCTGSQTVGVRHVGYECTILEVPRTYEKVQECYFITQLSGILEDIPNLLEDLKNYVNNEQPKSFVHMDVESCLSHDADDLDDMFHDKILDNYLPDEDTRVMLQNILSEILEDVINIEDYEFTERLLVNNTENIPQPGMKDLFPPSLGNISIPITEIVDQIKKELILDENIKDKIYILDNIVHQDSTATLKLVNKITSELALIPREEMELYMTQTFGLGSSEFSLDNIYNRICDEAVAELDTQYENGYDNEISSKNSDLAISRTALLALEREISQMEQMLEDVTGNSAKLSAEIPNGHTSGIQKVLERAHTSKNTSQMLGSSQDRLEFTKACSEENTWIDHNSKEQIISASEEPLPIETINNESDLEGIQVAERSLLDSVLEENILFLHSVMNAEQHVLYGAGDGVVLQDREAHFSTWTVLSTEDFMRNTLLEHSINIQRSSVSVAVSSSVADYSINSAQASITDLSISDIKENELSSSTDPQEEEDEFNSSIDPKENKFNSNTEGGSENGDLSQITSNTSGNNLEYGNLQHKKETELKDDSSKTDEKPKRNLMMSRHTKAFATVYFILFSLIFGGLALQPQCQ